LALIGYGIYVQSRFSIPFAVSGAAGLVAAAIGNGQFAHRFEAVQHLELDAEPDEAPPRSTMASLP
jgi:hypothetical protein